MQTSALILAGGDGVRLAPLSTPDYPKQFLALHGQRSLLQDTFHRVLPLCDPATQLWVATNARHVALVAHQLPRLPHTRILGETQKRNTAPVTALVASWLVRADPNAVMCVFPADHYIGDAAMFHALIRKAITTARSAEALVICGIQPTEPATTYGYIQRGEPLDHTDATRYHVTAFTEKPDRARAESYLRTGNYLWNSGMCVWKARVFLDELLTHQPALAASLQHAKDPAALPTFFAQAPALSIDHGVLEHSTRMVVLETPLPWSDLGSLATVRQLAADGVISPTVDLPDETVL